MIRKKTGREADLYEGAVERELTLSQRRTQ